MTKDFVARLKAVDQSVLTPLVRLVLENGTVEVVDWSYEALNKGASALRGDSYGLYRFRGRAQDQHKTESWSLILKAFGQQSSAVSIDKTDWNYWKREVLAYQSELLVDLPGGLTTARCFGVIEYPDQEYWVWLEDLGTGMDAVWPLERYGLAAQHLGQFNGAYLAGRPVPERPWLSRGRVRNWLDLAVPVVAALDNLITKPNISQWLPDHKIASIKRLWSKREQLLLALDNLPRCLCHHDAFRLNMMARQCDDGKEETVAIDWAFLGRGVIGEEIANSVAMNLNWLAVDAADAHQLDSLVFTSYLAGLREAGWRGETNLVRFGYAATISLCYHLAFDLLITKVWLLDLDSDEQREERTQQTMGHSLAASMRANALGTFHILEAAKLFDVPQVLFSSTIGTYGLDIRESVIDDSTLQRPQLFYGATKVFGEHMGSFIEENMGLISEPYGTLRSSDRG